MTKEEKEALHKSFCKKKEYLTGELQLHLNLDISKFCFDQKQVYRDNVARLQRKLQEVEAVLELLKGGN